MKICLYNIDLNDKILEYRDVMDEKFYVLNWSKCKTCSHVGNYTAAVNIDIG